MRHVAVVGSGVAGLTAAYVISGSARVTLFEADDRLGGHADTHRVGDLDIDTGFIVHNRRTYPTLLRLFDELGVPTQESDMSMSVRSDAAHGGRGLEWAGAKGPGGLFPRGRNTARPRFWRMLLEIPRFHRRARRLLAGPDDQRTLAEFLDEGGFSPYFRRHFMAPLVAAVWSCDPAVALDYPARYLFAFLQHHGMLRVFGSPTWRTVTGGSKEYVDRVAAALQARGSQIRVDTKVTSVVETVDGVEISDGNGERHQFDQVVLATHPGQALSMLADPTPLQTELLTAMPYSANIAQLHTDTSVLPRTEGARASWNFLERPDRSSVCVTYDLTRLMSLPTETRYLVTLGGTDLVDPDSVIATRDYEHPIYNPTSVAAQRRLPEIDSDRLVFAGAWHGWGFHEDGALSGRRAAERLGYDWAPAARSTEPRVFATTITHTRRGPLRKRFTNRSHMWVVDVDHLPDHGTLGRFEARDHLGDATRSIRDNVENFLALNGVREPIGQILMATNPRALGFCFNPISVFWCHDRTGRPVATVVEVHNTYGDRHAYLLPASGKETVAKQMYVSPFHGVEGEYDVVAPVPDDRLRIAVRLRTGERDHFDATLTGRLATPSLWRTATATSIGALLIRVHGIALWLRRLPVQPRPHHRQEGVR